jgi:hypothetical protein
MTTAWSPRLSRYRRPFRRENLPATFATAGLLCAALALLTPWYAVDNAVFAGHSPYVGYSLTQQTQYNSDGTLLVKPYESSPCACPATQGVFTQVQLFAWTGALLAAFAFWARGGAPRLKPSLRLAVTAIAAVLLVAGPILLALDLPPAFQDDGRFVGSIRPTGRWGASFAGSNTESAVQHTYWGPAIGWFLVLLGGALTLASVRRERGPTSVEAPALSQTARPAAPPLAAPPAAP